MGPARSLSVLAEKYADTPQNAPTLRLGTLKKWSQRCGWVERASEYDTRLDAEKNARADEIMRSGLALAHNRVEKLRALAGFLEEQMYEQGEDGVYHNVWVPDVKQIGSGESAERVDLERFNPALISEYRATLDDLAKETGGRIHKSEITGKDGTPLVIEYVNDWRSEGNG